MPFSCSWILFQRWIAHDYSQKTSPALGCDLSLKTEASVPIIKSDLPGRHAEWVSLCTAEASITVIPLQVQPHLEEDEERPLFTVRVTAEGTKKEVGGISGLSRQLLCPTPAWKRTKDKALLLSRVITSCQLLKCNLLTSGGSVGVSRVGHQLMLISWMAYHWWREPRPCWQLHKSHLCLQPNKKVCTGKWIHTEPIFNIFIYIYHPHPPSPPPSQANLSFWYGSQRKGAENDKWHE